MRKFITAALLVSASCFASWAQAENPPTFEQVSAHTEQLGRAYFAAYIARDWDNLAPLLAENGSFTDPTAAKSLVASAMQGKTRWYRFSARAMRGSRK